METVLYGNTLSAWAVAAGTMLGVLLGLGLTRRVAVARLGAFANRTRTDADDALVGLLQRTRNLFLIAVALWAGAALLTLPPRIEKLIAAVITVAVVIQLGLWGNAIATFLVDRHARRHEGAVASGGATVQALGFLVRFALWAVLALLALDNLGINITALVAGLGVGGVAVALAVQNILGDLFASLSIVLDRPFEIGDFIIVDDLMGTVEHVGLKTTRIRSLSGEQIVFSNADLLKSRIRNYKRMFERRVLFQFGVVYDTDPETMSRIPGMVKSIIESQKSVRFDRAHFKGFGDSSLDFEVVYYVLQPDYNVYMDIQQAINLSILNKFAAEGIDFAFPTRTLYVQAPTGPARAVPAPAGIPA